MKYIIKNDIAISKKLFNQKLYRVIDLLENNEI